jgi:hypothetical protein
MSKRDRGRKLVLESLEGRAYADASDGEVTDGDDPYMELLAQQSFFQQMYDYVFPSSSGPTITVSPWDAAVGVSGDWGNDDDMPNGMDAFADPILTPPTPSTPATSTDPLA